MKIIFYPESILHLYLILYSTPFTYAIDFIFFFVLILNNLFISFFVLGNTFPTSNKNFCVCRVSVTSKNRYLFAFLSKLSFWQMVVASSPFFRVVDKSWCAFRRMRWHCLLLFCIQNTCCLLFPFSHTQTHTGIHILSSSFVYQQTTGYFREKHYSAVLREDCLTKKAFWEQRKGAENEICWYFLGKLCICLFLVLLSWWSEKSSMNSFMNELYFGKCVGLL